MIYSDFKLRLFPEKMTLFDQQNSHFLGLKKWPVLCDGERFLQRTWSI